MPTDPREDTDAPPSRPVEVFLHHARWRHFMWAAFIGGLGLWCSFGFGPVGLLVGLVLLAAAAPSAIAFARTLKNDAGAINIDADGARLPPALCASAATRVPAADLRHAYLLRHELPPLTQGPLLVVATRGGVFTFPRDWFASESDQVRVVQAVNHVARSA